MNESSTIWVCVCCMLSHANGECCADDDHGGDRIEPWAKLGDGEHVAMGMSREEHACCECDVLAYPPGYRCPHERGEVECDCETDTYSTSQCEGCGSYLHGERYAFTLWTPASV